MGSVGALLPVGAGVTLLPVGAGVTSATVGRGEGLQPIARVTIASIFGKIRMSLTGWDFPALREHDRLVAERLEVIAAGR